MTTTHTLIDSQAEFEAVLPSLLSASEYAIDTEFLREKTYFPVLAVVQIAWTGAENASRVILLDALALDLRPLKPLMESDSVALVHAGSQDIPILRDEVGAAPKHLFDTQIAGAFLGHGLASLAKLVLAELGHKLSKGSQLTDWTRRPLDSAALEYAAADVTHLEALASILRKKLAERKRTEWAREECALMKERAITERSPDEAWWRLKGRNKLRGQACGVAQALGRVRLEEAIERDIPVRRVLSDLSMLAMAGRPPRHPGDLRKVRGLGRVPDAFSKRLLEAVSTGLELDESELHKPPVQKLPQSQRAASALCLAWVHHLADQQDVDQALLATRKDVEAVLAQDASRLDSGWRQELAGADIRALADGKAAIGVSDGSLVLHAL